MNRRGALLIGGVATFAVGVVATSAPALIDLHPPAASVSIVGLAALAFAIGVLVLRRAPLRAAETGDPEALTTTPQPGDDLDPVVGQFVYIAPTPSPRTGHDTAERRRRRELRAAAVGVLARLGEYTRTEATDLVEAGAWTDDPVAAAFLGEGRPPPRSLPDLIRDLLGRDSAFERGVRRASDAIAGYAGVEAPADATRRGRDHRDAGGRDPAPDGEREGHAAGPAPDGGGQDPESGPRPTGHWYGVGVVTLVSVGVGIFADRPALLLVGVVGIGFAAYARIWSPPSLDLSVDRRVEDSRPDPGDRVAVSVTVRNEGERPLLDLRVVDGVPDRLSVVDGSPRIGTALRPGEAATLSYTIEARRGTHEFGPAHAIARNPAASSEAERRVPAGTTITCPPRLRAAPDVAPLREWAARFTGRMETPAGGEGIEFHSTREYRPTDPMSHIDWNRRARTGELATLAFRRERSATVVLVIDRRSAALLSPEPHAPNAVERGVEAAGRLFGALSERGNRVGIAAVGSSSCWLAPGTGGVHHERARDLLATHPALAPVPGGEESNTWRWRREVRQRLDDDAQILFVSPIPDVYAARLARYLEADGYPVTVLSPDPTTDRTPRGRLARAARRLAIADLRSAGLAVIDWAWDEPLAVALSRGGRP